ncbi:hypothetical protein JTB14_017274 [Gonioctena quinquepunctata]|nr:hypothetical protein JTB14_017274 [Gonioctena quinquepunctata]
MTVKKGETSTKTKKKTSTETACASTSKTSATTSSKVIKSSSTKSETVHSGNLSKTSSSSSLQIADVSHLPVDAKIVKYKDYATPSTDIQQISSTLNQSTSNINQSISNLSQISGSTYTVTEPMEEIKLTYNKNDSGWNGKFIYEQPVENRKETVNQLVKSGDTTVVEQFSSSSHQESSSTSKSSTSGRVIEIVDGKQRIIDQKHHETGHSTLKSKDERLEGRNGTNITPEVHSKQTIIDHSTRYDSAVPELIEPKTEFSKVVRESHKVGDHTSSSLDSVKDVYTDKNKFSIRDETSHFINTEKTDTDNQMESNSTKTTMGNLAQSLSENSDKTLTTTTTVTYYDSKGNVIKTVTDVDTSVVPGSIQSEDHTTKFNYDKHSRVTDNSNITQVDSSKKNFESTSGRVIIDQCVDNTDLVYSNNRNYGKTGWNGKFTYEEPQENHKKNYLKTGSPVKGHDSHEKEETIKRFPDQEHYKGPKDTNTTKTPNISPEYLPAAGVSSKKRLPDTYSFIESKPSKI